MRKNAGNTPDSGLQDGTRRRFMRAAAGLGGLALLGRSGLGGAAGNVELPFANGRRALIAYPQKRPLMLMTSRPVQLETPFELFDQNVFTPNDAFFVRWHLSGMPTTVDPQSFRLKVHGRVKTPLTLSLGDLRQQFEPVEIAAVCECSGNSRGFFDPRVPGGEWGNGAMGNARWKGARLREVLDKAGVQADAVQTRFNGLDTGPLPQTPDFIKALDMDVARGEDVLLAYEMNGEPLPLLNGFPLRLVLPGWFGTYWVKMLNDVEVISEQDQNFWMSTAYRIPDNPCGCVPPGTKPEKSIPINRLTVRSFITNLVQGARLRAGHPQAVRGIAFDSGFGIRTVLLSTDGGKSWSETRLGRDYGPYSFRGWEASFTPRAGRHSLMSMAINRIGETQRATGRWNPGGYLRNVLESIQVQAS